MNSIVSPYRIEVKLRSCCRRRRRGFAFSRVDDEAIKYDSSTARGGFPANYRGRGR